MYSHRQSGAPLAWIVLLLTIPMLLFALLSTEMPVAGKVTVAAVLVVVIVSMWIFSSLTVSVDGIHLRWAFGPGLVRKAVPLSEIAHVERTRTSPIYGWGIHITPRGWLYNVWGLDAVWVRLHGGKQFLLGTDEPDRLVEAIERARPGGAEERGRRGRGR